MTRFAYDDQLAAIPAVVAQLLDAPSVAPLDPSRPIVLAGIGTSLHAARVATDWVAALTGGRVRALACDAHDVSTGTVPLTSSDQIVVISHRGTKTHPLGALRRAKELGSSTTAVVGADAPPQPADVEIRTCRNELAGTFSVSYLATLTALARLVFATFPEQSKDVTASLVDLPGALAAGLTHVPNSHWVRDLAERAPILISGFGTDLPTVQEAALKIKEGAWLWTEAMSPEFALHGTPASYRAEMSAIVLRPDSNDGGRSEQLVGVLRRLDLRVANCSAHDDADLRLEPAPHPLLRPFTAILPFHLLTAELARARGTDPDTLHGNREPWKSVMTSLTL